MYPPHPSEPAELRLYPSTDESALPVSPPLATDAQVTLMVGGRKFVTARTTLTAESDYFRRLLSGRWENEQPDGSWFIDADPDLFEHILHYLRYHIAPVFYDNEKGHDLGRYMALLVQTNYFQIDALEIWLKSKQYFNAVKIRCTVEEREGEFDTTVITDADVKFVGPVWETKHVYVCPRGIPVHTNYGLCGKDCKKHRPVTIRYDAGNTLRTAVIKKTVIIDEEACRP
ncbi:uncharacterized protein K452DRAFT_291649 [Aplosporella prunicola CBS 121167]|uniref:BTB domain-containing protein n=1 Tax=Aplosporella prunicola CBS 121167 TaxID=1176127 RepID=A0A6A6B1E6_9PEZI|nr:uncharacterized protein K452DRAFT_291649 [Aplosporella prunicola CBS 121167]KAF2137408.1 hypothetical protein K452DRAFT_291649 [Aplosporella prunicola CBS 121167]